MELLNYPLISVKYQRIGGDCSTHEYIGNKTVLARGVEFWPLISIYGYGNKTKGGYDNYYAQLFLVPILPRLEYEALDEEGRYPARAQEAALVVWELGPTEIGERYASVADCNGGNPVEALMPLYRPKLTEDEIYDLLMDIPSSRSVRGWEDVIGDYNQEIELDDAIAAFAKRQA